MIFFRVKPQKTTFGKTTCWLRLFESEHAIKVTHCLFNGLKLESSYYYAELKLYRKILHFKLHVFFSYNCYLQHFDLAWGFDLQNDCFENICAVFSS